MLSIQAERIRILRKQAENSEKPKKVPFEKPFVLSVFDSALKRYFVLGSQPKGISQEKNQFGAQFKLAAEKARVRFSCDSFENSLVEIHAADFQNFLDHLIDSFR